MKQNVDSYSNSKGLSGNGQVKLFPEVEKLNEQFRPIHYLGSKLRILDFIQNAVDDVSPSGGRVCDLFAGSGTVSMHLSRIRPVTSVDIQEYSRVLCSALLKPSSFEHPVNWFVDNCKNSKDYDRLLWCSQPLVDYEEHCMKQALQGELVPLCDLVENGSILGFEENPYYNCLPALRSAIQETNLRIQKYNLNGPGTLVLRYFGGLYFSYLQATHLDILLADINKLSIQDRDTFLAALLSTASDIVNTVGKQFAQPIKPRNSDGTPKKGIGKRVQKDRSYDVFSIFEKWVERYVSLDQPKFDHHIYKMDYSDALDKIIDSDVQVVYADPPYTRYHYSRYYHVLETISLRDNPVISKTCLNGKGNISRGVYREDRHQSPFSIKSQAGSAFETLFQKVRNLNASLVLSYSPFDENKPNTPRVNTISSLEAMAKKYFSNVCTISAGQFSHSKLNNSQRNFDTSYDAELLIICRK